MSQIVYKIATAAEWQQAVASGHYCGSMDDVRDGFIHLSARAQLRGTLDKHFRGKDGLVLVAFDESGLGPQLKWETSRDGQQFPHLYGHLPVSKALWERALTVGSTGHHLLQDDWFTC